MCTCTHSHTHTHQITYYTVNTNQHCCKQVLEIIVTRYYLRIINRSSLQNTDSFKQALTDMCEGVSSQGSVARISFISLKFWSFGGTESRLLSHSGFPPLYRNWSTLYLARPECERTTAPCKIIIIIITISNLTFTGFSTENVMPDCKTANVTYQQ